MFAHPLDALSVPQIDPGRPRTRPDRALGDKAYSSRANRALLRRRGIQAVIPEPDDQIGHRLRRGSHGGRPVDFDTEIYKTATPCNDPSTSSIARPGHPLRQTRPYLPRQSGCGPASATAR